MDTIVKYAKTFFNMVLSLAILIFLLLFVIFLVSQSPGKKTDSTGRLQSILPFSMNEGDITYVAQQAPPEPVPVSAPASAAANTPASNTPSTPVRTNYKNMTSSERQAVINRAKAMAEVKWTPKYNLYDDKGNYTFKKGQTYQGVPYTMDMYQVRSPEDFLNKIDGSKILYGNDCSGYVSAVWGIKRQTTLSLYNAVKSGTTVDGKAVCQISWEELQPADAILMNDGRGRGHIMLYLSTDKANSDNITVYEQNVITHVPYGPIPVARKDVRSRSDLVKQGYFPIRLMTLSK